ncbi:MAG: hypothetical protein F6K19_01735 [Cyanothece sp. SIO1E1]|nr:hypothetical protein [Cyanothece sp. SIO1E1]
MTTIATLTEEIMEYLTKGEHHSDINIDERAIRQDIKDAANELVRPQILETLGSGYYVATYYGIVVKAADDKSGGKEFIELPAEVIALPDNRGVHSIRPSTGGKGFIPIPINAYDIFDNALDCIMKDQFTFEAHTGNNRVLFNKRDGKGLIESGITSLIVQQVILDISNISDDDRFPMPPELLFTLKNMIYEKYIRIFGPPLNEITDNNENT